MTCEDFFERNAWQWEEEEERINYALSMMDGNAVTPFAITYLKKMTGEFGFPKHEGYDLWNNFKAQLHDKFFHNAPSSESSQGHGKSTT